MRNVTVSLPEDTVRWLRVEAAKADHSVSGWLADLLDKMRLQDDEYEAAMKRCLAIEPRKFQWVDGRKPTREELHDRLHDKSDILEAGAACSSQRQVGPRDLRSRNAP